MRLNVDHRWSHRSYDEIVVITDLYLSGYCHTYSNYDHGQVLNRIDMFVTYLEEMLEGRMLFVIGTVSHNFAYTSDFIQALEDKGIDGLVVLSPDDYLNDGTMNYMEVMNKYRQRSENNVHFKAVMSGDVIVFKDFTVIGDTGWMHSDSLNLKADGDSFHFLKNDKYMEGLREMTVSQINMLHDEFLLFSKDMMGVLKSVILLTHHKIDIEQYDVVSDEVHFINVFANPITGYFDSNAQYSNKIIHSLEDLSTGISFPIKRYNDLKFNLGYIRRMKVDGKYEYGVHIPNADEFDPQMNVWLI